MVLISGPRPGGCSNHALADELRRLGARHLTTNFYGPGTHAWAYWQRELHASLPMLLQALHVS